MPRPLTLFALLVVAGCSLSDVDDASRLGWEDALIKWNQAGPASYSFVLTQACTCPGPKTAVRIVVRNKVVESRTVIATDLPLDAASASQFPDVPGLFARIDRMLDLDYASLQVRYDDAYGFPAEIYFDLSVQQSDDTEAYVVTGFTPLS